MKRILIANALAASAAATVLLAIPSEASAATCASLTNPVYISGSSAVQPLLKTANAFLLASTPAITIVYQSLGSCAGMDAITNGTKVTSTPVIWDAGGVQGTCDLPTGGIASDVGASDVFPTTCPNITVPTTQRDFQGPIQVMNFVVPVASTQNAISQEAAFAVLGYGGAMYQVAPWTDKAFLFIRPDTSGTKQMIATAIGLVASKWKGTGDGAGGTTAFKSGDVLNAVSTSTNANSTFGILSSDFVDINRTTIRGLAYQAKGQLCGYLPDSSATTFDKINVREGRYAIWGPLHLVTTADANGPTNANVAAVVNAFTRKGLTTAQKQGMINAESAGHTVPQCAMKVSRTAEVGAEASFQPDEPCGCYFESKVGTAATSCKTCAMDSDCTVGTNTHCRYGYCEAK